MEKQLFFGALYIYPLIILLQAPDTPPFCPQRTNEKYLKPIRNIVIFLIFNYLPFAPMTQPSKATNKQVTHKICIVGRVLKLQSLKIINALHFLS